MIEFKFGERVARAARSRRFHCCRCNLILEFRNKKRLPSCATDAAANLGAIRRAGERARELVDHILTFGRRGEGEAGAHPHQGTARGEAVVARCIVAFACRDHGEQDIRKDDCIGGTRTIANG
jgi:hypothetical protein